MNIESCDSADSGNDVVDEQIDHDPCPSPGLGLFLFKKFYGSLSFCQVHVYLQDFYWPFRRSHHQR